MLISNDHDLDHAEYLRAKAMELFRGLQMCEEWLGELLNEGVMGEAPSTNLVGDAKYEKAMSNMICAAMDCYDDLDDAIKEYAAKVR